MSREPDAPVELAALARRSCPGPDGHGSGPYVHAKCYSCAKAAALAGRPLPDEVRIFAGFGVPPRPSEDGWISLGRLAAFELAPLERPRRYVAADGFRALLDALRHVGEAEG